MRAVENKYFSASVGTNLPSDFSSSMRKKITGNYGLKEDRSMKILGSKINYKTDIMIFLIFSKKFFLAKFYAVEFLTGFKRSFNQ